MVITVRNAIRHWTCTVAMLMQTVAYGQEVLPDDADETVDEVLVWGRAIDLVGAADSASEGIVGYDDLAARPLLRVGELVEVIPGMIATQHSGGGKANQYFLRGINLDHGTDFSVQFEGMPINFRTHAHGQGYLDMNFIIPELVKTIEYRKGTYSADVGDFSAASSSRIETFDRLDDGFAKLTYGTENYMRAVIANSWDVEAGTLLLGGEVRRSDGPWENAEDVRLFNGYAKYATKIWGKSTEFIGTYYSNEWNATDQIPYRAFLSGDLGRYGFVDPSVGGETSRLNFITTFSADQFHYQAFVSKYSMNLFGNPTYYLNDPVNGDQIEQEDNRWIFGGHVDHARALNWMGKVVFLKVGAETRFDNISDVNLFKTVSRKRLSSVRNDSVDEFSFGVYMDAELNWNDRFRTTLGMRADYYRWNVSALRSENSGSGFDSIVSPKLSVAYSFNDQWEVYANYGGGFHSNDVRAAELRVDPVTGDPAESFAAIVSAEGIEAGFRAEISDKLNLSATFFSLTLDSELIFVGDAGTTEPNEGTERTGAEFVFFWQPTQWLALDFSAAKTDARFSDALSGQNKIPDAQDIISAFGATLHMQGGLTASMRIRYFGDAPLVEDDSVRKEGTTLVNLGISYPIRDFDLGLDILNLLNSTGNDIEYFYESRLFNEAQPVEDIHFHPVESREFRIRIGYRF